MRDGESGGFERGVQGQRVSGGDCPKATIRYSTLLLKMMSTGGVTQDTHAVLIAVCCLQAHGSVDDILLQ